MEIKGNLKILSELPKIRRESEKLWLSGSSGHGTIDAYAKSFRISNGNGFMDVLVVYTEGYNDQSGKNVVLNEILSMQILHVSVKNGSHIKDISSEFSEVGVDKIEDFLFNHIFPEI